MAISEVCKFEVKEELDRLCQDKGISRNEASKELATFYKEVVGVEVDWQTVKKKDQRARGVGTNVPSKQPDAPTHDTKTEAAQGDVAPVLECDCHSCGKSFSIPISETGFDDDVFELCKKLKSRIYELRRGAWNANSRKFVLDMVQPLVILAAKENKRKREH
jgi:hypothetical protein